MLRLCKMSVKAVAKVIAKKQLPSTLSPVIDVAVFLNPQKFNVLHKLFTRFSTVKSSVLTDVNRCVSTISTDTITTTTYI